MKDKKCQECTKSTREHENLNEYHRRFGKLWCSHKKKVVGSDEVCDKFR